MLRPMINCNDIYREPMSYRDGMLVCEVQVNGGDQASPALTVRDYKGNVSFLSFMRREDAVAFFAFGLGFYEPATTDRGDMLTLAYELQQAVDPDELRAEDVPALLERVQRLAQLVLDREAGLRKAAEGTEDPA